MSAAIRNFGIVGLGKMGADLSEIKENHKAPAMPPGGGMGDMY